MVAFSEGETDDNILLNKEIQIVAQLLWKNVEKGDWNLISSSILLS